MSRVSPTLEAQAQISSLGMVSGPRCRCSRARNYRAAVCARKQPGDAPLDEIHASRDRSGRTKVPLQLAHDALTNAVLSTRRAYQRAAQIAGRRVNR